MIGVAHLTERLLAGLARRRSKPANTIDVDLRRNAGQVDRDDLVVTLALAGQVVALVLDRPVRRLQVVEEDEVLVAEHLVVLAQRQRAGVQVEVHAGGRADVPAQADLKS